MGNVRVQSLTVPEADCRELRTYQGDERMTTRRDEQYARQQDQLAEHARFESITEPELVDPGMDAIARSEERYRELMSSPDAPKPSYMQAAFVVGQALSDAPGSAEIQAKLAALEAEKVLTLAKLDQITRVEQEEAQARDTARAVEYIPAKMRAALAEVTHFKPEAPAVPLVAPSSAMAARVAPALEDAEKMRSLIDLWIRHFGTSIDRMHRLAGEDNADLVNELMRGLPTDAAHVRHVTSLLRRVCEVVEVKLALERTLDREAQALKAVVARADTRGPMTVMQDRSVAFYDQEAEVVGALTRLGTVNDDAIAGLWSAARVITTDLEAIARIRTEHTGETFAPLVWENRGAEVGGAIEAEQRTRETVILEPGEGARWSPFDQVTDTLRRLRGA
jgi:hypothetical protein